MKTALLAVATGVVLGAGLFTATTVTPASQPAAVAATQVAAPAPVVIVPTTTAAVPVPTAPTTTKRTASRSATTTKSKPKTTTKRAPHVVGSGYDPSDPSYQGADDPGSAAGRPKTSGESQYEYGCQQGYITVGC